VSSSAASGRPFATILSMKLYLSSIDVPTPDDLAALIGKPLAKVRVALIPNAQDYYSERARDYQVGRRVTNMESLGLTVTTIDLRKLDSTEAVTNQLVDYDLVWAMGGNTFCLRYEMKRSGFDEAIKTLLARGKVYGGDSAGALVAGLSIGGIESADIPEFAEQVIEEGLRLVPYVVLPHVDNPEFADVMPIVRARSAKDTLIELKDSQAVIFEDKDYRIVESH
jgi:dipeptidase E